MTLIDAVVFDADGTLLDTREFIYQSYEHTLAFYGYPIPARTFMAEHMGMPLVECYRAFAPEGDIEAFCTERRIFQTNNLELVDSYEGLVDTMDTLRGAGLKIAICSSRGTSVLVTLEHVGIKGHCDVIIHGDSVEKHKPDPEGFHKAVRAIGVDPLRTAMVGNTVADIEAGKNAGAAFTIGVTHGFGLRDALENAGADYIVERLSDLIPLLTEMR